MKKNILLDKRLSWDIAPEIELALNEDSVEGMGWSFDCNFKLDFDGNIARIDSRFYPPTNSYGPNWDGFVTLTVDGKEISRREFECKNLQELKSEVEKYVKELKESIVSKITAALKQ